MLHSQIKVNAVVLLHPLLHHEFVGCSCYVRLMAQCDPEPTDTLIRKTASNAEAIIGNDFDQILSIAYILNCTLTFHELILLRIGVSIVHF